MIAPLAHHLLNLINADPGTVFRRVNTLRGRKLRQRAQKQSANDDPDPEPAHTPAKAKSHSWGIVSTIKAPLKEVLGFVAYHLEQGAHRVYVYLDDADVATYAALKSHPKVRVTDTDEAYWQKKGGRPHKHQARQTMNAADAYTKRVEVAWLAHVDHDEFLVWNTPLSAQLAALGADCLCARIRPVEALE